MYSMCEEFPVCVKNLSSADKKWNIQVMELCLLNHAEEELRALILQKASTAPVTNVTRWHLRYYGLVGVWFRESWLKAFILVCSSQKKPLKLLVRLSHTVRNEHWSMQNTSSTFIKIADNKSEDIFSPAEP